MFHPLYLDKLNNGQLRYLAEKLTEAEDKIGDLTIPIPADWEVPYVFRRSPSFADGNWTVFDGNVITQDMIAEWLMLEV